MASFCEKNGAIRVTNTIQCNRAIAVVCSRMVMIKAANFPNRVTIYFYFNFKGKNQKPVLANRENTDIPSQAASSNSVLPIIFLLK